MRNCLRPKSFLNQMMISSCEQISPVFITGNYRSGTTLVTQLIKAHPKFFITYDSVHFMRFCYGKYNVSNGNIDYHKLLEDMNKRLNVRLERKIDLSNLSRRLEGMGSVDYAVIYNELMVYLMFESNRQLRWGEKENVCWGGISAFLKMFPKGKAIHVIRDPRDVLLSFKKFTYEPGLRYMDAVFTCLGSMQSALEYKKLFSENNYMIIRFESVLESPESFSKELCDFLEVPYDTKMLDTKHYTDKTGKPWKANTSLYDNIPGISKRAIGRYKEYLSNAEIFIVETVNRCVMQHFDYELEGRCPDKQCWNATYELLADNFVARRFRRWLKTNRGIEEYPSKPPAFESL